MAWGNSEVQGVVLLNYFVDAHMLVFCVRVEGSDNPEVPGNPVDDIISYWAHPKNHYHCEHLHESS